jgi:hypothetical protein
MEDIEFLKKNSEERSYLFHIDSALRDRTVFPTASSFGIQFDTPFKNVTCFDILAAECPRTLNTICSYNNSLAIVPADGQLRLTNLTLGSHTDDTLLETLNNVLQPLGVTANFASSPANLTLTLVFLSAQRFSLPMDQSTCADVLGFDELAYNHLKNGKYFYADVSAPHTFASYILNPVVVTVYTWLRTDYTPERPAVPDVTGRYFAQLLQNEKLGIVTEIQVATATTADFDWFIVPSDLNGAPNLAAPIISGSAHAVSAGGLAEVTFDIRTSPYLTAMSNYWLVLDFESTGNHPLVAESAPAIAPLSVVYSSNGSSWSGLDDDHLQMVGKVTVTTGAQTITAPDIYNLTGSNYTFLRIPELEAHMYRSRAFEAYNYPIAKFQMAIIGFSDTRYDFSTVPPRTFHPIGKLTNLTFNLTDAKGNPYQFNGVNVCFTCVLKYMVPKARLPFNDKILNPYYEPDTTIVSEAPSSEEDSSDFQSSDCE